MHYITIINVFQQVCLYYLWVAFFYFQIFYIDFQYLLCIVDDFYFG